MPLVPRSCYNAAMKNGKGAPQMRHPVRGVLWAVALSLALWLAAGCAPPAAPAVQPTPTASLPLPDSAAVIEAKIAQVPTRAVPLHLTILYTNDVRGSVEPCG